MSKNNRRMLQGICVVCGNKKSSFTKISGNGIGNTILKTIGNLGELHLPTSNGEYVPNGSFNNQNKYSYCGPGTKYEQRLREGYQGINELDRMCKLHDQFYNENTDTESRNVSDAALAHRAHEISNDPRFDASQRWWADKVERIMNAKVKFGLGIDSKNLKRGPMKRK
jgi:hypothetical protein